MTQPASSTSPSIYGALRGPVLLIALGALLALDYAGKMSFARTWPVLLILFGIFTLLDRGGKTTA